MAKEAQQTEKGSIRKDPRHPLFKGIWIRSALYKILELNPIDREVVSFVWGFSEAKKGCTASNAYMADLFGVCIGTIKDSLRKLKLLRLIINTGRDHYHRVLKVNPGVIRDRAKAWDEAYSGKVVEAHKEPPRKRRAPKKRKDRSFSKPPPDAINMDETGSDFDPPQEENRVRKQQKPGQKTSQTGSETHPLINKGLLKDNKGASPTPSPADGAGSGDASGGSMRDVYEEMQPQELLAEYEKGGWNRAYIDKNCLEILEKARQAMAGVVCNG